MTTELMPVALERRDCAAPDTFEWTLKVGEEEVRTIWAGKDAVAALRKLLDIERTPLQTRCGRCGPLVGGHHANTCPYRRAE